MGLAKSLKSPTELTSTFAGTPLVMAPELINGVRYTKKVDIWSLGTLLFQLLTGSHPFMGKDLKDLGNKVNKGSYKIPAGIKLSHDCINFLDDCLRFDEHKRIGFPEVLQHPFLKGQSTPMNQKESIYLNSKRKFIKHDPEPARAEPHTFGIQNKASYREMLPRR